MDIFEKQRKRIVEMTPVVGYNVVGVDTFEELGDELYFVSHHKTKAAADKKASAMRRASPMDRFYVYEPQVADDEIAS